MQSTKLGGRPSFSIHKEMSGIITQLENRKVINRVPPRGPSQHTTILSSPGNVAHVIEEDHDPFDEVLKKHESHSKLKEGGMLMSSSRDRLA